MPPREKAWCEKMRHMNHDFDYVCYGNELLERYGQDPYVKQLLSLGEAWAFIMDRLRALLLLEEGGIWLDPDCDPVRPLRTIDWGWNSPATFIYSTRPPHRKDVALHRGVTFADNTFLASAPQSRVMKRVMEAWKPERPRANGHDCGCQVIEYQNLDGWDTLALNWRYFYSLANEPTTLCLHDAHNLGSWKDWRKTNA